MIVIILVLLSIHATSCELTQQHQKGFLLRKQPRRRPWRQEGTTGR
jgi:hypothetical protein